MGSVSRDHKSKVSPPQGTALPSCLKAEHEGKEAQGSPRGWDLEGSRGGDSMDHSNTSTGITECFCKANNLPVWVMVLSDSQWPQEP